MKEGAWGRYSRCRLGLIVKKGELAVDLSDEVLAGACVADQGKAVNPRVAKLLESVSTS